ncbi:MAG TPA: DNA topoisomerase IB [Candidatus Dormibacteraeota bacterium]
MEVSEESVEAAREAGLRYVTDDQPGIERQRRGGGFVYRDPDGRQVRDRSTLERIRSLAIPPAWTAVWISADPRGHIQATGRDARGRKQYRYHPRWRQVRDENKYGRMVDFARALPRIRRRVARDLRRRGLPREKVLATVVRLLETTLMRVGNEEYARDNESFGLTTLRDRHARIRGRQVQLYFRGKGGKEHRIGVSDPRIARVVRACQELPGQELFQYVGGDGERHRISSDDVNDYIRSIAGEGFSAKDFRTWAGTVLAARALRDLEEFDTEAQAKRNVVHAIESVAKQLGNTRDVCRKCYVHPTLLDAYLDGGLVEQLEARGQSSLRGLPSEEAAVLALIQQRLKRDARRARRQAA